MKFYSFSTVSRNSLFSCDDDDDRNCETKLPRTHTQTYFYFLVYCLIQNGSRNKDWLLSSHGKLYSGGNCFCKMPNWWKFNKRLLNSSDLWMSLASVTYDGGSSAAPSVMGKMWSGTSQITTHTESALSVTGPFGLIN